MMMPVTIFVSVLCRSQLYCEAPPAPSTASLLQGTACNTALRNYSHNSGRLISFTVTLLIATLGQGA